MAQYWITVASIGYSVPIIDGFIQLFRRLRNTKLSLKTVQLQAYTLYRHHVFLKEQIPLSCIFN